MKLNVRIKYMLVLLLIVILTGFLPNPPSYYITISGQYLDKKNNPIVSAQVDYRHSGSIIGNDTTDVEGNFLFYVWFVGFETTQQPGKETLELTGSNPFTHKISFRANILEKGVLRIVDMQGKLIALKELQKGSYMINWGGKNTSPGIYMVSLQTKSTQKTIKILQQQSGSKGLETSIVNNQPKHKIDYNLLTQDSITFSRENSTLLSIPANGSDTNFIQTGNVGPEITSYIENITAEIGEEIEWNIFDHHYNDDLTNLSTIIPGATIEGDSIYKFVVPGAGVFDQRVNLTDPEDGSLTDYLEWQVFVDQPLIPPTANDDNYELQEDGGVHQGNVTENDNDPDGTIEAVEVITPPQNGNATVEGLIIKYLSEDDYNGSDSLKYKVIDNDGLSDTAWVHYMITPVNDAPHVTNPFENVYNLLEDDSLMIIVHPNHYDDIDSYPLSFPINNLINAEGSQPSDDEVKIKPIPHWFGTMTNVSIDAFDGEYTTTSNSFEIVVEAVNDAPNVNDDQASTPYNTPVTIDVLLNDNDILDPDGGLNPASVNVIEQPAVGEITNINSGTGEITYQPPVGFSGNVTFTYEVYDNGVPPPALPGQADVVVTVEEGNLQPIANDDTDETSEDVSKETSVLANDDDPDGNLLPGTVEITEQPSNGTILNINSSTGAITYKGSFNWNGEDIYKYRVGDDGTPQLWDTATVTMTVTPVNDAPYEVTPILAQTIDEDTEWEYTVRPTNVDDIDSPVLTYTLENVVNATWQADADTLKVIPNANWYGTIAGVVVKASDGEYVTSLTPFDLMVDPVNDYPVAVDDTAVVDEEQTVVIDVVANDTDPLDPEGFIDATTVDTAGLLQPSHGEITGIDSVTGEITYEAFQVTGTDPVIDTFEYRIADDGGLYDTADVVVTINQVYYTYFQVKALMGDTLLPGATLQIGSSDYFLATGDTSLVVTPGTFEVNATHPNSIDWTSIWEEYTAIQRPGQFANVEQRAGGDNTSPVTFGATADTLVMYKVMNDFNIWDVSLAICTGPSGETIRFGFQDPTAYFDESGTNQVPNSTTVSRVQDLLFNHMPSATLNKLLMVYDQGSNPPTTEPYLEMAINSGFPGPGTNATGWDSNFEITDCYAHWPDNSSTNILWEEIIQAVQNHVDVGISLTQYNAPNWEISPFGQQCLRFGYNFDPGTHFVTPARSNDLKFIKDFYGSKFDFNKGEFAMPYTNSLAVDFFCFIKILR